MHHGFYRCECGSNIDHKAAQVDMIDRSLEWAYGGEGEKGREDEDRCNRRHILASALSGMKAFVDVGCGVGGSSRHIVRKYGSSVVQGEGLSLSPYQIRRAKQFTAAGNLTDRLNYQVADAMHMPFPDNKFDLGM